VQKSYHIDTTLVHLTKMLLLRTNVFLPQNERQVLVVVGVSSMLITRGNKRNLTWSKYNSNGL